MPRARPVPPTPPPPTDEVVDPADEALAQDPPTPPPPPPPADALLAALAQRLESLEAAVLRGPTRSPRRADADGLAAAPAGSGGTTPQASPRRTHAHAEDSPAGPPAALDHHSDVESGSEADELPVPQRHSSVQDFLRGADRHLPCPHVYHNPYPRAPQLHHRACHYSPSKAGDATHGEIQRAVHKTHDKLLVEVCKEELCTLVPVLSALFDLQDSTRRAR
ncbi:hypothetical protein AB1Y20_018054 [Prymnesium parvum]|uniref:Uncharacterized protein n=1 Tax=Prymnesium parvum TaxID=97485 RepID=A0AB34JMF4_PRYPA